jgi:hypothetical protein
MDDSDYGKASYFLVKHLIAQLVGTGVISGQSFAETLDTHVDELPEDVANTIRRLVQAINPPPQVEEQPP